MYQDSSKSDMSADQIAPRLFMGALPPPGKRVCDAGFSTLILCAQRREYRVTYPFYTPVERAFSGVQLFVVDLDDNYDSPLTEQEFLRAQTAAHLVKQTVRDQKNALVTCVMGRNRSGLVTALALRSLCDWPGEKAMTQVRKMRNAPAVLDNPQFAGLLAKLPAPSVQARTSGTRPAVPAHRFDRYRRPIS